MRNVKFEILKLVSDRSFCVILMLLILINAGFVFQRATQPYMGYTKIDKKTVYDSLYHLDDEQKLQSLETQYEDLKMFEVIWSLNNSEVALSQDFFDGYPDEIKEKLPEYIERYNKGNYLRYTDSLFGERELIAAVLKEVREVMQYDAYLSEIDLSAKSMDGSSFFSDEDTFAYRNAAKTPEAFEHLKGVKLQPGLSEGITMATQSDITDILAVLFVLLSCLFLIIPEEENKMFALIQSTVGGRVKTVSAKILTMLLICILAVFFLYGTNGLLSNYLFGFGNLNRNIQSVDGFIGSPYNISVGEYLLFYIGTKVIALFMFSVIILFFCIKSKNAIVVYVATALLFVVSSAAFRLIAPQSAWSPLHFVNLITLLKVIPIFAGYTNLNIFGYPVNVISVWIPAGILCLSIFIWLCARSFGTDNKKQAGRRKWGRLQFGNPFRKAVFHSMSGNEWYKQLVVNKTVLLLLLFVAFQIYNYVGMEVLVTTDDLYYKRYMTKLSGPLTEEKSDWIEDEKQHLEDTAQAMNALVMQYANHEIDRQQYEAQAIYYQGVLVMQGAFESVYQRYQYIVQMQGEGQSLHFVYDRGINVLIGEDGATDMLTNALMLCLVVIACFSGWFVREKINRVHMLLKTTQNGSGKLFSVKYLSAVIYTLPIFLAAYCPNLIFALANYETTGFSAPAGSLPLLAGFGEQLSVWQALFLFYASHLLGAYVILSVTLAISVFSQKHIAAMLITSVFVLLPIVLSIIGWDLFAGFIPFSLLTANSILSGSPLPDVILSVLLIAGTTFSAYKRYTHIPM